MRLGFLFFFLSAIFYSPVLTAQTDSTFTDTIVIIKDPHVIRHEVVIRSLSEPARNIPPIKFGLYYGIGGNKIQSNMTSIEIKGKSFQNFGVQIGYSFKNLAFTTGVGTLTTNVGYIQTKHFESISHVQQQRIVRQNTIRYDSAGILIEKTYYKYDTITLEIRDIKYYEERNNYQLKFIQVPLSINYVIKKPGSKLSFSPGIQMIMNIKWSDGENMFRLKKTSWFAGCNLKLEYNLTDHISAGFTGFWQQCLGDMYERDHKEKWKLAGLNFGMNYQF